MDKQYDVSPEMRKLFEIKQKQRAKAKEYFQKMLYNPYRPLDAGIPFDPAVMRHGALQIYRHTIFPATPKFIAKSMTFLIPFILSYYCIKYITNSNEESLRSGLISYEDRINKFI